MPFNSLTRQAGIKLGPLLLETLVKHYIDRKHGDGNTQLHQDELLYDEAFNIIKTFMEAATKHTIEELQEFSNTYVPSSPWSHVVRLLVPMSCCDDAATYLIQALGGEEATKRMVGGTKWWQVRGMKGVDAEWITAKKDYQEAKRRDKAHQKERSGHGHNQDWHHNGEPSADGEDTPATYQPEMDTMRCILFAHGGGYYFGSIGQERYSIQRYARKINGRVFTINYRLSPQYPFPCAIQDLLAAYLFLIRPPEGASHRPVDPAHIVVAGDSAGGGLCIALLQVLRDTGLPMPAGGVLISPWCDLTHSFPSIHINTATDVIPQYGLSFHKPSTLWPSPPEEYSTEMDGIRSRIRQIIHRTHDDVLPTPAAVPPMHDAPPPGENHDVPLEHTGQTLHLDSSASLPTEQPDQTISLTTAAGEVLTIHDQVQMYAPNSLLTHPLVSPVLSYLGGLPPLLVLASEKEVLRDEIIYFAHKAAYPDRYHVNEEARKLYSPLENIEQRHGPTKIHLQVYDDAAHTLPVLFAFTTPAKYCYRAMATFCKYVTGLPLQPSGTMSDFSSPIPIASSPDNLSEADEDSRESTPMTARSHSTPSVQRRRSHEPRSPPPELEELSAPGSPPRSPLHKFSGRMRHPSSFFRFHGAHHQREGSHSHSMSRQATDASDVAGPRFSMRSRTHEDDGLRRAGEPSVYDNGLDTMIRERVSTLGVIRPLEPEGELLALQLPEALVGIVSERTMRRYFEARAKFDKKFAKTTKSIEKKRRRNFSRAKNDTLKNMTQLQNYLAQEDGLRATAAVAKGVGEGLVSAGSWPWTWALDLDEKPPASSIVARRDTEEARRLAKIADQAVLMTDHTMSGNNLWSLIVDFLTVVPDKEEHKHQRKHKHQHHASVDSARSSEEKIRSRFAWFDSKHRKAEGALKATRSKEG